MIPHTGTPSICTSTHYATVGVDTKACKCVVDGNKVSVTFEKLLLT